MIDKLVKELRRALKSTSENNGEKFDGLFTYFTD
jgi:hypothetical protein